MKPSSPWSIKGIEPEAREAAKMSARRAGVPLGVWLSATIRKAASELLRSGGSSQANREAPAPTPNFDINGTPGETPESPNGARPPAPTTEAVLQSINRLAAKLEASEQRTTETLAPLAEKVRNLSDQIEDIKETPSRSTPAPWNARWHAWPNDWTRWRKARGSAVAAAAAKVAAAT